MSDNEGWSENEKILLVVAWVMFPLAAALQAPALLGIACVFFALAASREFQ